MDFEGTILGDLIKKQTSLQEAYWGTGQKFQRLLNDAMYPYRGGGSGYGYNRYQPNYFPGSRFGIERGTPPWQNVTPPTTETTEEE